MSKLEDLTKEVDALRKERECDLCEGKGTFEAFGHDATCGGCSGTGRKRDPWPRVVTGLKMPATGGDMFTAPLRGKEAIGKFVKVRVAGSANEEQSTHLGILLGDLPMGLSGKFIVEGELALSWAVGNPAMFVPALKRVVMGYESWWGLVESPDELRTIMDTDIAAVPYVQALASLEGGEPDVKNASVGVKTKLDS